MAPNYFAKYLRRSTEPKPSVADDQEKHRRAPNAPSGDNTHPERIESSSANSSKLDQSAMQVVVEVPGSFEDIIIREDEAEQQSAPHAEQLEDVTYQTSLLKQELKDTVDVLRSDKRRLSEMIKSKVNKIQKMEDHLADLQRERQQYMHQSNVERSNVKQHLRARIQQLEDLRSENKLLKVSLEECKDRIFSMQPVQGMSDTQLQNSYTDLCNSIEYWIEEQFGEMEDVVRQVLTAGCPGDDPHVVWNHVTQAEVDTIALEPELNNALLVALVSRYLYSHFLSAERVFPGLPDSTESCIREINAGIGNIRPAEDMESIQSWRVDFYKTLSSLKSAKNAREYALQIASVNIEKSFISVRSMADDAGPQRSACHQIVADAADLAGNIRQTIAMYDFEDDPYGYVEAECGVLKLENWKKYKIIDSRTGQALRSSAIPTADRNGRIGKILFVVHPAFIRKPTNAVAAITLVKPTVAVRFDQEIPRGGRRKGRG